MKRYIHSLLAVLSCAILCLGCSLTAFAEVTLPEGAVEGLPEKLTVMDSDGNSVDSATGEYFFEVEGMLPYTEYSKNVQVMNLREDKAYHIYLYAEPLSSSGSIALEDECTAVLTLSGDVLYTGSVTGNGNVDISQTPLDLGLYTPGDSRTLNCTITWYPSSDGSIDYGERLVDADGTHVVRESEGSETYYGEVLFKWKFYAVVDETYTPPKTGVLAGSNSILYFAILGVCLVLIATMLVLILRKKKRLSEHSKGTQP